MIGIIVRIVSILEKGHDVMMGLKAFLTNEHCVAVCRSVLQCVAACCSVLQCVAVCVQNILRARRAKPFLMNKLCVTINIVLQCIAVCSSVLQCVPVCSSVCAVHVEGKVG